MDHSGPVFFGIGMVTLFLLEKRNPLVSFGGGVTVVGVLVFFIFDLVMRKEMPLAIALGIILLFVCSGMYFSNSTEEPPQHSRDSLLFMLLVTVTWGAINLIIGLMLIQSLPFVDFVSQLHADSGIILLEFAALMGIIIVKTIQRLNSTSKPKKPTPRQN